MKCDTEAEPLQCRLAYPHKNKVHALIGRRQHESQQCRRQMTRDMTAYKHHVNEKYVHVPLGKVVRADPCDQMDRR